MIPLNGKDAFVTLDDPVCKQDVLFDVNAADFYFKLPSNAFEKKKNARCFTDCELLGITKHICCNGLISDDCMQHSNLILPCADETSCFVVDQTPDHIKCKNESKIVQLK